MKKTKAIRRLGMISAMMGLIDPKQARQQRRVDKDMMYSHEGGWAAVQRKRARQAGYR